MKPLLDSKSMVPLLLAVLLLGGCGWHLRGAGGPSLEGLRVAVSAETEAAAELLPELRAQLQRAGASIAEGGEVPTVVLLDQSMAQRAISIDSGADVREYELNYQLRFAVRGPDGELLRGPEVVQERGTYRADAEDVLGTESRAEEVAVSLRRNAAMLLAARVRAALGRVGD